ncbi:ABC transporter permease [uncultured Treponema sp.]|uniref:ABC transporter permease n=1 Tax=uncultured Treponema sp. TaxID=162155 RepID=UPI000E846524|nr:ABC transporter permease [uncultured Treponema sp.]HAZ95670.1 ABC transporter permease [Treponema sp.]
MFDTFLDFLVPFSGAMLGAVSQGVLWGIMALGVYITFKILDFADMTVDGSFALGGCVCALLVVRGVNPLLAVFVATIAGSIAGFITGFLTTKFKIPGILAGILVQLALYSINLHVLGGPNQPLTRVHTTIMDWINKAFNLSEFFPYSATSVSSLITGIIFTGAAIAVLYWFFGTELGSAIRSTGDNAAMSRAQGINTDSMQILALMIANALVAMSGSLVMQQQRFGDVSMGIGTIVIGLASIIIGEVIFGKRFGFWWSLLSVVFGSVIYRLIIALVLQLGMKTQDLKLLSAVVVAIALSVPVLKQKAARCKKNSAEAKNA